MKKYLISSLIIIALCSVQNTNAQMIWLPSEFITTIQDDENSQFQTTPNYSYVGTTEGGGVETNSIVSGWISCACNTSGKCMPGTRGGLSGCGGNCTNCTMKQGKIQMIDANGISKAFLSGGFVNFTDPTQVLTDYNTIYPGMFNELLVQPQTQTAINNLINQLSGGVVIPAVIVNSDLTVSPAPGFSLQPVIVFGRGMLIHIPENSGNSMAIVNGGKASCSCTAGGCSLKTMLGATYCDGNCTGTCKLSTKINSTQSDFQQIFVSATL